MTDTATPHTSNASGDLTRGAIGRHLFNMTSPMILGLVAAFSISLADAYFLGQLGTEELAAISFTFPVVFTVTTLAIGLGAGATSVVSRAIGENDLHQVRRLATDAFILAVIIVVVFCIAGWLTIEPLFRLLGADGQIFIHIKAYMNIWYPGMPFLVVPMVANNLIRATGNAFIPSLIMTVTSALNVLLDPVFIFGGFGIPAMGVEGAAWASLIARSAGFVISTTIIVWREKLIVFAIPPLQELRTSWRRVLGIGLPAAAGNMLNPIGIGLVTSFIAGYSASSVAAFGAATRIEAFAAIPLLALSSAIGPIAGQNWGAGHLDRIRLALRLSFMFSVFWSLLLAAAAFPGGPWLAAAFATDPVVAEQIELYLRIISTSLMGYGVIVVAAACCNAIGRPMWSIAIFGGRMMVLYIPLAWIASAFFGVTSVFWAIWIANLLAGSFACVAVFGILDQSRCA